MELDANARTALVTGGSRGIGQAIAQTLARDGFQIILTCVSRLDDAEKTAAKIHEQGALAKAVKVDVADAKAIEEFFASEIKDRVNLHVLVNNAGITRDGLLLRMKDEYFDEVISVDLRGAFVCTREAAKIMSRKRSGRIVNIASVVGQMGNPGQVNYSAAKAGLIGMTKACARELASRQVTVNAVAPGFIETEMTRALNQETAQAYLEKIPLKRFGSPDDVAEAVSFFASDKSAYITGQVLGVNGGLYT